MDFQCPICGKQVQIKNIPEAEQHLKACGKIPRKVASPVPVASEDLVLPKTFSLILPVQSQNSTHKQHWTVAAKQVGAWRNCILACCPGLMGADFIWSSWHVTRLIPKRGKYQDHANLIGGAKPLIDALTYHRIIRDDAPQYFTASYSQTKLTDHAQAAELLRTKTLTLLTLLEASHDH